MTARSHSGSVVAALAAVVVAAAVLPLSGGVAAGQQQPTVRVGTATVEAGGTTTVPVVLSAAPDGLAGYELAVTVGDGQVASVDGADYPSAVTLTSTPTVTGGRTEVRLRAADVERAVEPGAEGVVLARVRLDGVDAGRTDLSVDVVRMDDDDGGPMAPATEAGRLSVRTDDVATEDGGVTTPDGASGRVDSLPVGQETLPLVASAAAAVLLLAALLVRRE
jgi:hypothetical protein